MIHHTELLNLIAEKIQAKSYLEIGCFNLEHNFNHIKVPMKMGVDPDLNSKANCNMTSDEYFESYCQMFDLIFIDGLHEAGQVKKDIKNSYFHLKENGVIVVHDCNPHSEHITHYPRDSREWTGNVYKTICQIQSPKFTIDFDYGCCVLFKSDDLKFNNLEVTWEEFDLSRKDLLNLVKVEEGIKILETELNKQYANV